MKKMATKLIRLLSEKKRMESGYGSQPNQSGNPPTNNNNNGLNHRDLETEELIEDQVMKMLTHLTKPYFFSWIFGLKSCANLA